MDKRNPGLDNFPLVTLDQEHGTKTVAAVADVILGEIRGLLLLFQNFRQATLHTLDNNDNLISPLELKQNEHP